MVDPALPAKRRILNGAKVAKFLATAAANTQIRSYISYVLSLIHHLHQLGGYLGPVSHAVMVTVADAANKWGLESPYGMD
jgi:hypothetical protein